MLNDYDGQAGDEAWLTAETAAVMHDLARTVTEAPPLRLTADEAGFSPAGTRRGARGTRHWRSWGAPLTAAAVVVALAISLAIVRSSPNGSVVAPTPTASPGLGGAPRYYVALTKDNGIVAGDSVTGKTIATFAAPAPHTQFSAVTAAADDLTFVVSVLTSSDGSFRTTSTVTCSWYELRLAPGTADPARLTPLPIEPQPAGPSPLVALFNATLSGSGQQLAVAEYTAWNGTAVKVFSVATGRLLHDWTFTDPSIPPAPKNRGPGFGGAGLELPAMTWIDGDQTLALATPDLKHLGERTDPAETVRELNVAGPASGDLLTDSTVVWVAPIVKYPADQVQSPAEVLDECAMSPGSSLVISADGKTFSCTGQSPTDGYTQSFRTYPITLDTTAAEKGRNDYQVTHAEALGLDTPMVQWASSSGETIIAAWNTYTKGTLTDAVGGLHIGVISHGKFTPLRFPRGFTLVGYASQIAW